MDINLAVAQILKLHCSKARETGGRACSLFVDVLGESVDGLLGVLVVAVHDRPGSGVECVPHGLLLRLVRFHVGFHLLHQTVILSAEWGWEKELQHRQSS